MIVNLDIETVPDQRSGAYEAFLKDAQENFTAPSGLTKTQACADLGLTGNDAKFTSKDDAILKWEALFSKEKAPEIAEANYRRTALDGGKGEIFSIAWAAEDDEVNCASREWIDGRLSSEAAMIDKFFAQLSSRLKMRKPLFVGQYIAGFDLKFIFHRCVILKIKAPFELPFWGRHDQHFYDTQEAWAGFKGRMSQDNLCSALGIQGKPGDIDGSKVWDFVKTGDTDRVVEYNIDDVVKNREIYKRLNFIESINIDVKAA